MQIISKVVQKLGAQEKLIRRPLEFFRYERKNRGDGLGGCATQCQSGRSMIEMLGVLAIIGVLSVGGIMGYSKAMMRYKINKTIEQITYIAGNVRTTFASQGNYDGAGNNTILKKAHIVPDDMWKEGKYSPQSLWDGNFYIGSVSKNSSDAAGNKAFYSRYIDIPEEVCIDLITHDWKNAQIVALSIYDDEDTDFEYIIIPPARLDDAIKLCQRANYNHRIGVNFISDIDTSDSYWKDQIDATTQRLGGS